MIRPFFPTLRITRTGSPRITRITAAAWIGLAIAAGGCDRQSPSPSTAARAQPVVATTPDAPALESDALERAAYVVVELPGGGRLESRHADWLETGVAPGSIAKLATLTEALRRGVINSDTRIACTRRLILADGRRADCSHPPLAGPLDVVEAIAQSCNVFAATVARRLTRAQLSNGLVQLGLPPVAPDEDAVAAAIGLGEGRVRPSRLVDLLLRAIEGPPAVRDGVARAADTGTAAAFARAGVTAFAKTGTSRMKSGRSLGLAVAASPRPRPTRAVVVMLPGGGGADAAELAARLLAPPTERLRIGRPRPAGGYDVEPMDLDDYVAHVVAGETDAATPAAARQALAIAARTFALANRHRHDADGFDLCSLTHCQVTRPPDAAARVAAQVTSGRVLKAAGGIVPVFYSAACGGTLDDASAVAGDLAALRDLPWTHARPDPAGGDEPAWRTVVDAAALGEALRRAGFRGSQLSALHVEANGAGRVRRVRLEGFEPATLDGDAFRRLVGHDLGWNVIRSTRFDVQRTARGYELRGRGHGHGVGLCVFGACRLAREGRSTDQILDAYFPGLTVSTLAAGGGRRGSAVVRLRLPEAEERHRVELLALVERGLASLAAATGEIPPARLDLVVHPTADSYRRATGRPWWTAAAARVDGEGWTIHTIPIESLRARGYLETTIRHELAHVMIDQRLAGRPLWVREGAATHFSGGPLASMDGPCPSDDDFRRAASQDAMATAYRRAATCVAKAMAAGQAWQDLGATPR